MSTELELAQARIKQLEGQVSVLTRQEEHLVPLPNGDLHRGFKSKFADANIDVEVIPETAGNPLDRAMAKCLKAAKGGHALTCLWCGLQYDTHNSEKDLREHLKKDHPTVVDGYDKVVPEILMANLTEAQERLKAVPA